MRAGRRGGFTLAEMLVYLSLVTTGMVVIGGLEMQSTRALQMQQALIDIQVQSSAMLHELRRDVEQARALEVDRGALRVRRLDGAVVTYEKGARHETRDPAPTRRTDYATNEALDVEVASAPGARSAIVHVRATFVSGGVRRDYVTSAAPRREVTGD